MSDDPLIFIAQAVVDPIWWFAVVCGPIFMVAILVGGIIHVRLMDDMMNAHLRVAPPPPKLEEK